MECYYLRYVSKSGKFDEWGYTYLEEDDLGENDISSYTVYFNGHKEHEEKECINHCIEFGICQYLYRGEDSGYVLIDKEEYEWHQIK